MTTPHDLSPAERLLLWAEGMRPLEAAAILLIRALDGRLLTGPWVRETPAGLLRFDADAAAAESGYLSGGERRILAIVASLVSEAHPVDLGDAIAGLDADTAHGVLIVLSHAAGLPDGTVSSAPAPSDDQALREVEAALAATPDVIPTESEQAALDAELDAVLEPLLDRLQMYQLASGITAETIAEMIQERLLDDDEITKDI